MRSWSRGLEGGAAPERGPGGGEPPSPLAKPDLLLLALREAASEFVFRTLDLREATCGLGVLEAVVREDIGVRDGAFIGGDQVPGLYLVAAQHLLVEDGSLDVAMPDEAPEPVAASARFGEGGGAHGFPFPHQACSGRPRAIELTTERIRMCVHFCRALVPCPLLLTMALNLLARRHAHCSEGFFALHPGMQRRETALRSRA